MKRNDNPRRAAREHTDNPKRAVREVVESESQENEGNTEVEDDGTDEETLIRSKYIKKKSVLWKKQSFGR